MIDLLANIFPIVIGLFFFLVMLYFLWPESKPAVRQNRFAKNRFGGAAEYTDTTRTSVHKRANRNEL